MSRYEMLRGRCPRTLFSIFLVLCSFHLRNSLKMFMTLLFFFGLHFFSDSVWLYTRYSANSEVCAIESRGNAKATVSGLQDMISTLNSLSIQRSNMLIGLLALSLTNFTFPTVNLALAIPFPLPLVFYSIGWASYNNNIICTHEALEGI